MFTPNTARLRQSFPVSTVPKCKGTSTMSFGIICFIAPIFLILSEFFSVVGPNSMEWTSNWSKAPPKWCMFSSFTFFRFTTLRLRPPASVSSVLRRSSASLFCFYAANWASFKAIFFCSVFRRSSLSAFSRLTFWNFVSSYLACSAR